MQKSRIDKFVVIVAGGTGTRMRSKLPKQFMILAEQPVMMHTIRAFNKFDSRIKIIVVLHSSYLDFWSSICEKYNFDIPHKIVIGGKTRFNSVKNGLDAINNDNGIVAIHDAVRPLVSAGTISKCFKYAIKKGNAVPAITPGDSVRMKINDTGKSVERKNILLIQTPQVFSFSLIKQAYMQDYKKEFTDDATVFETRGEKINIVEGNTLNIKLTTRADMEFAKAAMVWHKK